MNWLPDPVEELFGAEATVEEAYDLLTVDVPAATWTTALETARTRLGCTYFDWLSAVDEPETGFRVCAHVAAVAPGSVRRLLLRTTVPHSAPVLASAVDVYAGAAWHERETHEMFGVTFEGHPHLVPLLLPDGFEGHPLRKDFVLAARVAKAWPGAKEPGESSAGHGAPKRRQMLPPGVPDPNEWGPQKGQLPPAPTRPARGAAGAGERPVRRSRSAASATPATPASGADAAETPARPARRARSVSEGSASQRPAASAVPGAPVGGPDAGAAEASATPARRSRSVSEGSASQRPSASAAPGSGSGADAAEAPVRPARRSRSASQGSASQRPATPGAPVGGPDAAEAPAKPSRTSDAPWHNAKPAFDEPPQPPRAPKAGPDGVPGSESEGASETAPDDGKDDTATPNPAEPSIRTPDETAPDETTRDKTAPGETTPDKTTPGPTDPDTTAGGTP
ncbi:NADH-quinone oxidoreductase subunit C [Streptomyces sp. NPDC046939]|uniref:NADH-quinone oxidoreductase subunit C n=1 Tax=Streptomyces sp. NPDC046939 TaxID=3155376 RepID=UPI0033ED08A8